MKRLCALSLGFLLTFFSVPRAESQVLRVDATMTASAGDSQQTGMELIQIPTPPVDVVFAEISFERPLSPGTEIELWPAAADSATPDRSLGRLLWVTDERTGGLVRFDVTPIIRAWQTGEIENRGLLVNVVVPEADSAMVQSRSMLATETPVQFLYQKTPWDASKTGVEPRAGERGKKREGQIAEQPK